MEPTFDDGAATDDEEDSEDEDEYEGDEDESDHEDDHADSDRKKKDAGQKKKATKKDAGSDASTGKKKATSDAGHASHDDAGSGLGEDALPPSDGDGGSGGFDGGTHAGPDHPAPGGGPSLGDPSRDNGVSGGDITRAPVGGAGGNTASGSDPVLPPASGSSTGEPEELPTGHGDHEEPIVPPGPSASDAAPTPTPTPTPGSSGPTIVTPPSNSGRPSNVPPSLPPITPPAATPPGSTPSATHDHGDTNPPAGTPPASGPRMTDPVRDPTPPVVGPPAPPVAANDACDELTYASFGQGFFTKYCQVCHSDGRPPNFNSLSTIVGARTRIEVRAIEGIPTIMPPPGMPAPSADEKAKLQQWLNCSPLD